jgi:16S rRNA (guanine527-N7)-methyltransferase
MVTKGHPQNFKSTLVTNMGSYRVNLSSETVDLLASYYELLLRWNERLHLVAPCSPETFATRHVLESLLLLPYLPQGVEVADVGSGAGLPIIPCLIAREDLRATLIESSPKKTVFLREALKEVGRSRAATITAQPFENTGTPEARIVSCRALDAFVSKAEALYRWAPEGSTLLLFGGNTLRESLENIGAVFSYDHIPHSEKRFLFVVRKRHGQRRQAAEVAGDVGQGESFT